MPVVGFTIVWPDGVEQRCSSPSTVIHQHLAPGLALPVDQFVARTEVALAAASDRVKERFGMRCTAAAAQQEAIERAAARYADGDVRVLVVG